MATKPKFLVGTIIATDTHIGTIESGFFADGVWNYNIGDNATIVPAEGTEARGYRKGPRYVREEDVKWLQRTFGGRWEEVRRQ